ncbi:MAG: EAL domain-containing protein [Pseudomonadales bacterium]
MKLSADAVMVVDKEREVVAYNQQFVDLWKFDTTLLELGTNDMAMAHVAAQVVDAESFISRANAAHINPFDDSFDIVQLKDGRTLERSFSSYSDANGITGKVVIYRDVTESYRAQFDLERVEERLDQARKIAGIGIWEWDIAGGKIFLSRDISELLELPQNQEFTPSFLKEVLAANSIGEVELAELKSRLLRDHEFDLEYSFSMADRPLKLRIRCVANTGLDGRLSRITGAIQDITATYEQERAAAVSSTIMGHASEGVLVADVDQRIVDVNPAFCKIMNVSRDKILGHSVSVLSGPAGASIYADIVAALEAHDQWEGEVESDFSGNGQRTYTGKWIICRDDAGNVIYYIATFVDITEQKQAEKSIEQLSYYDGLTKLANRSFFKELLRHEIDASIEHQSSVAFLHIALDRFSVVNDELGHTAGDYLLSEVGSRLKSFARESDIVARLGADQFAITLTNVEDVGRAEGMAERVIKQLSEPYRIKRQNIYIGVSIGLCIAPEQASNVASCMRKASIAMTDAKAKGGNRYVVASEARGEVSQLALEAELRVGLEKKQFLVYYQPIVDAKTGATIAFEALVRWQRPNKGVVLPGEFLPAASEVGLLPQLEDWVLESVCTQLSVWASKDMALIPVAVNISAEQFSNTRLVDKIDSALTRHNINPALLELEITETTAVADLSVTANVMKQLNSLGVKIAIDDFGTGYSSLSYLKNLPLFKLKIDRSLINDMAGSDNDREIVRAIAEMAASLGLKVVAEGVENWRQQELLVKVGVQYLQGFYFSYPLPVHQAEKALSAAGVSLP